MMKADILTPECFGSKVVAQAQTAACLSCPLKDGCFEAAALGRDDVIKGMEMDFKSRLAPTYELRAQIKKAKKFWERCLLPVKPKQKKDQSTIAKRFSDHGVDLFRFKAGENPFPKDPGDPYFQIGEFILQGLPFKNRDVIEYVQTHISQKMLRSSIQTRVSVMLSVMAKSGVLTKYEGKILCLVR